MKSTRPIYININALTVVKIIFVFILFYVMFLAKDILAALFVALILSSALEPWVAYMQSKKIPRILGVIAIYLSVFMIIFMTVFMITPPIMKQGGQLINNFPQIFDVVVSKVFVLKYYSIKYGVLDNIKASIMSMSSSLQGAAGSVFSTVSNILGGIFWVFLVSVITFYILVQENAIKKAVWFMAPVKNQVHIIGLINKMQQMIGLWLRGQMILSFIIFVLIYAGLSTLGLFTGYEIEYALVLALIAGLTEFVPYLGPIFAAIPAIFLAFIQSPVLALSVAIMYYIVQLLENNLIVPNLMRKVVGLNPVISIVALLIGFKIAGVAGAVLAIPVSTALLVVVKDVFEQKSISEKELSKTKK